MLAAKKKPQPPPPKQGFIPKSSPPNFLFFPAKKGSTGAAGSVAAEPVIKLLRLLHTITSSLNAVAQKEKVTRVATACCRCHTRSRRAGRSCSKKLRSRARRWRSCGLSPSSGGRSLLCMPPLPCPPSHFRHRLPVLNSRLILGTYFRSRAARSSPACRSRLTLPQVGNAQVVLPSNIRPGVYNVR